MKSETEPDFWKLSNLLAGVRDVSGMLSRAGRALRLDRSLFHEVAGDHLATGQALLILLLMFAGSGLADALNQSIPGSPLTKFLLDVIGSFVAWLLVVSLAVVAGRALKGHASFTRTFRAVSFALLPEVITWLHYIPGIGPLFNIAGNVMILIAVWIALQEALRLSKWRALLIPVFALIIVVLAIEIVSLVIGGAALTIETLLVRRRRDLGDFGWENASRSCPAGRLQLAAGWSQYPWCCPKSSCSGSRWSLW
jgi:hypothetical protein